MSKIKLESRFILAAIMGSLINLLILGSWFFFRIRPIFPEIENFKLNILNEEINQSYSSYNDLETDIKAVLEKNPVSINLEDINGKLIMGKKIKNNFSFLNKIVKVGDDVYLLKIYFNNFINITWLIVELLLLQIFVIAVIFIFIIIYTRQTLLKPIGSLIEDIRNYKLGKKPKKRVIGNELDLIQNEFTNLAYSLDEEKKEQTRIIASISHDIKTPLTSIIGYASLIKDQNLNDETAQYNEKIYTKALNIKDILATFDDYLLKEERILLKKTMIQIKDIVNELNNDYKIELSNNNIEFIVNTKIPNELIEIDVLKMKRIFSNMISNSVRYLKNSGKIEIEIASDKKDYLFYVRDNGPGVNEQLLKKIFKPLFTTDTSRKISGLGLSIVKEFVEMHGGTIKAYNKNGLVILFTIPKNKS